MTAYENLTDLRLSVSCTHDFVELNSMIPDSFLERLRYLFTGVTDATGPGRSNAYLGDADEHKDGNDDYPLSNLQQQQHPNTEHTNGVFDLVS